MIFTRKIIVWYIKMSEKDSFPLWQKILYGVLGFVTLMLLLWMLDKIGLLGFLAGVNAS
jgi:hypothetical protein